MLTQSLRISSGEATRRLALAETILPTIDTITGTLTPPTQPVLAGAFLTGQIAQEQALMISKFVTDAQTLLHDGRITTATLNEVQNTLVTSGQNEDPDFLRRIGTRVLNLLDPDGQNPGPAELRAKQGITFRQPRRGLVGFNGYLTLEQHETIMTIISRFANPNHHKNINPTTTEDTTTSTTHSQHRGYGGCYRWVGYAGYGPRSSIHGTRSPLRGRCRVRHPLHPHDPHTPTTGRNPGYFKNPTCFRNLRCFRILRILRLFRSRRSAGSVRVR